MKSIRTTPRAAFTLIELLVVISIIALLASIAIPTLNVVMRKAKEAQARAAIAGLIIGIKAYQTEYNRMPDPGLTAGGTGNQTDTVLVQDGGEGNLMPILNPDQNSTPPVANPRRINFYDPPIAKNGANGYDKTSGALLDPWSAATAGNSAHFYRVAMDYDGDGAILAANDPTGVATDNLPTPVIAWSTGAPTKPPTENSGTDTQSAKFFICSWK